MSTRTRYIIVASAATIAVLSLTAFLLRFSLDEADKLSSVLTLLLTVSSSAISVIFTRLPQRQSPESPTATGSATSSASGAAPDVSVGAVYGTFVKGNRNKVRNKTVR